MLRRNITQNTWSLIGNTAVLAMQIIARDTLKEALAGGTAAGCWISGVEKADWTGLPI